VLPAAVSLRKQGANNGATTSFLISTPESGVDSISITYALLDPIMTVARPFVAFVTAAVAGIAENLFNPSAANSKITPDLTCPVDGCCDGKHCAPEVHKHHHTIFEKFRAGFRFAIFDLWGDLAGWFFVGLFLSGAISTLIPSDLLTTYLGGGAFAMLVMLAAGIPLRHFVYVAIAGPNLETAAEYRFLRQIGADTVGMSSVPENLVAVHAGMKVLGLSVITDACFPDNLHPARVEDILRTANEAQPRLEALVTGFLRKAPRP